MSVMLATYRIMLVRNSLVYNTKIIMMIAYDMDHEQKLSSIIRNSYV